MSIAPVSCRFIRARISSGENTTVETSVTITDGIISAIGESSSKNHPDIDIEAQWLLPGAIDGHVHFDDPGFTHREDFSSGSKAAAAGGVTTIVDMPCTSLPPVTDASSFHNKLQIVAPKAHIDFAFWGGVRGNDFSEASVRKNLTELRSCGAKSIKTYLISGMDTFSDLAADQLEVVLRIAKSLDLLVGVHAEDRQSICRATTDKLKLNPMPSAYAESRSAKAETLGIETCIALAEKTGARLHVVHLAAGDGAIAIRNARARGVRISAETCPHYLAFTKEEDLEILGGILKTAPVVKSSSDRDELWKAISDGTLEMVATDHAPGKWPEEKKTGNIWTDYGGVPGVETLAPFIISEGVSKGRITLAQAVSLLSSGPARIHSINSRKGAIAVGFDADFMVVDPRHTWIVRASDLYTRQKYTPFDGWQFHGKVIRTYLRGREIYDISRGIVGAPAGKLVH